MRSGRCGSSSPSWRQGRATFTYADGRPIRPEYLTHRFHTLVRQLDLPPIRPHDPRHGAATLAPPTPTPLSVLPETAHLGISPRQSRNTALFTLAADDPAAILAKTLGIHIKAAVQWQKISGGDWAAYAADVRSRLEH